MPRGRSACRTRPCDFWRSSAAYTSRRSQFVPLCVSEGRFVSSGHIGGMGWGLAAHVFLPRYGGRHNGASMRPVHGVVPCERRGETREGDHPLCRALKTNRCPKSGDTRAEVVRPCPGAARCAVGFASRGSRLDVAAGEGGTLQPRPLPYPV